jgi:organic radical activating enzyme
MAEHSVRVSEIFGPTFQGEGPAAGERAAFVRTVGCNLNCGWCDTPYTWDWAGELGHRYDRTRETTVMTPAAVADEAMRRSDGLVVFSGGEPLTQQRALAAVADILRRCGRVVDVETNGTVALKPALGAALRRVVVSPKLANSGVAEHRRWRLPVLAELAGHPGAVFKFVVTGPGDLAEIGRLLDALRAGGAEVAGRRIWVMPEGTSADVVQGRARQLVDHVLATGWNLSLRLHLALWPDQARGV